MFEWLVYIGGLADVEVPLDEPYGGYVIVDRGKAGKFPKDVATSLMEHGQDSAEENPVHQPQWRKATSKEIAAAEKAAAEPNETAEPAEAPAEEGEQS